MSNIYNNTTDQEQVEAQKDMRAMMFLLEYTVGYGMFWKGIFSERKRNHFRKVCLIFCLSKESVHLPNVISLKFLWVYYGVS